MNGTTKKQYDIYAFIEEYIKKNNFSPSYRDIQEQFGFSSLGTVYSYIQRLKRKGMLTAEKQCSRSFTLAQALKDKNSSDISIPLIGHIKAGYPIEMLLQPKTIALSSALILHEEQTYALQAKGDGFNEELIADGDILIVETSKEIHNGDTVIALINAHNTLVKRYYHEDSYVRLESKTPHHRPMIVREKDVTVQGHLIALIREF